jgi:hypothetical protein
MKRIHSLSPTIKAVFLWLLLSVLWSTAKADNPPFTVKTGLFDQAQPNTLGLNAAEGTETVTIFQPVDSTDHYSNGVVMAVFKDWLYCQWQSSAKDEDAQDTWVAYSRSQDGKSWSPPMTLAATLEKGFCSSGGWWVADDTLVAYINVWPSGVSPRGGYTYYSTSTDGLTWSAMQPLLMADGDTLKGIFEQDPHALPDGRIIGAAHFQPGLISSPVYTDDPSGMRGWIRAPFPHLTFAGDISREIEPSWFLRSDDTIVMVFRDQAGTFRRLASVSGDRGESWSTPVLTDMPDSRAKQSAGNLADSAAFMVGNPVNNKTRIPLAVALSRDGMEFYTAYLLRQGGDDLQAQRYTGQSKTLGYSYPKSMVWQDYLYVSYSTNKEDVQYTRVPLTSLVIDTSTADTSATTLISPFLPENRKIEILACANGIIKISIRDYHHDGMISIYNLNGRLLYRNKLNESEGYYDMKQHPAGTYIIHVISGSGKETLLFSNW